MGASTAHCETGCQGASAPAARLRPRTVTTVLAKALGAGEKLAAVVGREACMRNLDPHRPARTPAVFQSGTGNDGTAGLAAAAAAVATYADLERGGEYPRLNGLAARLAAGDLEVVGSTPALNSRV